MSKDFLTNFVSMVKVQDHTAAGTSRIASASVDMTQDGGYEGVVFITSFGTPNADNGCYVQQSSDNSAFTDLLGTNVSSGSSDEDIIIEVKRPTKPYVRLYAERDGASSTLESVWALRYGPRHRPTTGNTLSGTAIQEQHSSPAEGAA